MASAATCKFTFFWRKDSPFSQWHPAEFTVNEVEYNCAEQYMMHQKAFLFGDEDVAQQVMQRASPKAQKSLGRKVKNFDEETWNANCEDIVKRANKAKFSQNNKLLEALLSTAGTTLAEASPVDCIWGIGLTADHPQAQSESTWRGQNKLGYILTQVRDEIIKERRLLSGRRSADDSPTATASSSDR